MILTVATAYTRDGGHNQPAHTEQVQVLVDPDLPTLGETVAEPYGYTIRLRAWDTQVLLHELLHVILGRRVATDTDPHGHEVINRVEVGLLPHLALLADRPTPLTPAPATR